MSEVEVGAATLEEVGAFYFHSGEHTVIRIDGEAVALGHVRAIDGRPWALLNLSEKAGSHGVRIVRCLHRYFRERNETIYAVCASQASERLLRVVGFAPTQETVAGGKRVWRWTR